MPRRQPDNRDFRRFVGAVRNEVEGLAADLAGGRLTAPEWGGRMLATLTAAHGSAGWYGRRRAGDLAEFDQDDRRFGYLAAQEEMPFLHAFEQDLLTGRYRDEAGALSVAAVARRAGMYLTKLYGTANEAFSLVADEPVWWVLGEVSTSHCEDCPELARNSPYAPGQLPTYPAAGETRCLTACRCSLRTESGLEGFRP